MADYKYEKTYNEIVGITKDNTLVILDHVFEYTDNFKGATRYEMTTLSQEDIDNSNGSDDYIEGLWRDAVQNSETTEGLTKYSEKFKEEFKEQFDDLYFVGDDSSFRCETDEAVEKLTDEQRAELESVLGVKGKDFVDWNAGCCGRIGDDYKKWEWKKLFRPDLLELIAKFEG